MASSMDLEATSHVSLLSLASEVEPVVTAAALLAAGAFGPLELVSNGNGNGRLLSALGAETDASLEQAAALLQRTGFSFVSSSMTPKLKSDGAELLQAASGRYEHLFLLFLTL